MAPNTEIMKTRDNSITTINNRFDELKRLSNLNRKLSFIKPKQPNISDLLQKEYEDEDDDDDESSSTTSTPKMDNKSHKDSDVNGEHDETCGSTTFSERDRANPKDKQNKSRFNFLLQQCSLHEETRKTPPSRIQSEKSRRGTVQLQNGRTLQKRQSLPYMSTDRTNGTLLHHRKNSRDISTQNETVTGMINRNRSKSFVPEESAMANMSNRRRKSFMAQLANERRERSSLPNIEPADKLRLDSSSFRRRPSRDVSIQSEIVQGMVTNNSRKDRRRTSFKTLIAQEREERLSMPDITPVDSNDLLNQHRLCRDVSVHSEAVKGMVQPRSRPRAVTTRRASANLQRTHSERGSGDSCSVTTASSSNINYEPQKLPQQTSYISSTSVSSEPNSDDQNHLKTKSHTNHLEQVTESDSSFASTESPNPPNCSAISPSSLGSANTMSDVSSFHHSVSGSQLNSACGPDSSIAFLINTLKTQMVDFHGVSNDDKKSSKSLHTCCKILKQLEESHAAEISNLGNQVEKWRNLYVDEITHGEKDEEMLLEKTKTTSRKKKLPELPHL